jgi:hypothetical protein
MDGGGGFQGGGRKHLAKQAEMRGGGGGGVSAASWPPGARPLRQLRIWRPGSLLSPERVMVMPWFFLSFPFLSE